MLIVVCMCVRHIFLISQYCLYRKTERDDRRKQASDVLGEVRRSRMGDMMRALVGIR